MNVYLTRDSVCAGDDVDAPHATNFTVPDGTTIGNLMRIIQSSHLPMVQGGKATWSVISGVPVAVLAQQWSDAKLLSSFELGISELETSDGVVKLHAIYHAQLNPKIVFEVLERLKL